MTTDTIADMLTRIRNANLARHQVVQIPSTKVTKKYRTSFIYRRVN
jgi:small subunit ribosomal protein S8